MDFSALEAWFNQTMRVHFEDGSALEGKLMGADEVGLEFEVIRFLNYTDEGFKPGESVEGDLQFVFVPWGHVKLLTRWG